ncbi:MAG TPA: hypothetical protein VFU22_12950 [Roseiflexaceae bacterium]|nr:hypothetical protein [Roseiflexaceae bacterium]
MHNRTTSVIVLDLPNIRIRSTRLAREQELIVEVESVATTIDCRSCGRSIGELVGYEQPRGIGALPTISGTARVYFFPKRFRCPYCADHPITTQPFSWPAADGTHEKVVGG